MNVSGVLLLIYISINVHITSFFLRLIRLNYVSYVVCKIGPTIITVDCGEELRRPEVTYVVEKILYTTVEAQHIH